MKFSLIAAVDSKMGIGLHGKIPWNIPSDLAHFNKITRGNGKNAVIMGRITWESLPAQHKPLKNRLNIVITRNAEYSLPKGALLAESLEKALALAKENRAQETFVIGGAQIYYDAIQNPACEKIYLTEIQGNFHCDAFFPKTDPSKFAKTSESETREENGIKFRFAEYERK